MNKQFNLFDDEISPSKETEQIKTEQPLNLVISNQSDSKKNTVIYKKIQKIETLKKQLQKSKDELSHIKATYSKLATKSETQYFKNKELFIEKLFSYLTTAKGFTIWQKDLLEALINSDLMELSNQGYTSEKLNTINDALLQMNADKIKPEDEALFNEIMGGFFEEMGFDDTDFEFSDFDPNTFKEQMKDDFFKKQAEQEAKYNHESKKEKIKHTDKSFQKLYKNLVKKAHPDLVIDLEEKEIREQWMKELSSAWNERNYYKLLLLQNKIDTDASAETYIDKNQEKSLIKQLNEEIKNLESEKYILKSEMGENAFYFKNFYSRSQKNIEKKIHEYCAKMNDTNNQLNELINVQLKTKASTKRYLEAVYDLYYADDF
ncbi:MAG: hypothetical protein ACPGUH_06360 [Winogradskyella sp.]